MIMGVFGTNQIVFQRAMGTSSMTKAKWTYLFSGPLLFFTLSVSALVGFVIFAHFAALCCDPYSSDPDVDRPDKVLPYFVMKVLHYPTVPGIFYGGVMCGTLSVTSAATNTVSALLWSDVVSYWFGKTSQFRQTVIYRMLSIVFGCVVIGISFIFESRKESTTLVNTIASFTAVVLGPIFAMFLFSALLPFVNGIGAFAGGFCAAATTLWMFISRFKMPAGFQRLPLPDSWCPVANATISPVANITCEVSTVRANQGDFTWFQDIDWFSKITYWYYSIVSIIIVFVVGVLVSLLTNPFVRHTTQKKYLFPIIRKYAGQEDEEDMKTGQGSSTKPKEEAKKKPVEPPEYVSRL